MDDEWVLLRDGGFSSGSDSDSDVRVDGGGGDDTASEDGSDSGFAVVRAGRARPAAGAAAPAPATAVVALPLQKPLRFRFLKKAVSLGDASSSEASGGVLGERPGRADDAATDATGAISDGHGDALPASAASGVEEEEHAESSGEEEEEEEEEDTDSSCEEDEEDTDSCCDEDEEEGTDSCCDEEEEEDAESSGEKVESGEGETQSATATNDCKEVSYGEEDPLVRAIILDEVIGAISYGHVKALPEPASGETSGAKEYTDSCCWEKEKEEEEEHSCCDEEDDDDAENSGDEEYTDSDEEEEQYSDYSCCDDDEDYTDSCCDDEEDETDSCCDEDDSEEDTESSGEEEESGQTQTATDECKEDCPEDDKKDTTAQKLQGGDADDDCFGISVSEDTDYSESEDESGYIDIVPSPPRGSDAGETAGIACADAEAEEAAVDGDGVEECSDSESNEDEEESECGDEEDGSDASSWTGDAHDYDGLGYGSSDLVESDSDEGDGTEDSSGAEESDAEGDGGTDGSGAEETSADEEDDIDGGDVVDEESNNDEVATDVVSDHNAEPKPETSEQPEIVAHSYDDIDTDSDMEQSDYQRPEIAARSYDDIDTDSDMEESDYDEDDDGDDNPDEEESCCGDGTGCFEAGSCCCSCWGEEDETYSSEAEESCSGEEDGTDSSSSDAEGSDDGIESCDEQESDKRCELVGRNRKYDDIDTSNTDDSECAGDELKPVRRKYDDIDTSDAEESDHSIHKVCRLCGNTVGLKPCTRPVEVAGGGYDYFDPFNIVGRAEVICKKGKEIFITYGDDDKLFVYKPEADGGGGYDDIDTDTEYGGEACDTHVAELGGTAGGVDEALESTKQPKHDDVVMKAASDAAGATSPSSGSAPPGRQPPRTLAELDRALAREAAAAVVALESALEGWRDATRQAMAMAEASYLARQAAAVAEPEPVAPPPAHAREHPDLLEESVAVAVSDLVFAFFISVVFALCFLVFNLF